MLDAAAASARAPWDAIDWPPQVHLVLFVHRVDGLTPGVYAYLRDPAVLRRMARGDAPGVSVGTPIERLERSNDLFLLFPFDVHLGRRIACRAIRTSPRDGFFSLGMIARLESSLRERGDWFYRRLFWECGLIGQVLYLEAEAAGARATGIGCFYDDPVHETARAVRQRLAEPLSLLDGSAGGRRAADDRAGVRVGGPWEGPWEGG